MNRVPLCYKTLNLDVQIASEDKKALTEAPVSLAGRFRGTQRQFSKNGRFYDRDVKVV